MMKLTLLQIMEFVSKSSLFLIVFSLIVVSAQAHFMNFLGDGSAGLSFSPAEPAWANSKSKIFIQLLNPETGDPFNNLAVTHEKKLHSFIIGGDLDTFYHTHPDDYELGFSQQEQGIYGIEYTFPYSGNYAMLVTFSSEGKNYAKLIQFNVQGEPVFPKPNYNFLRAKNFGGYEVNLTAVKNIPVGTEVNLDYSISKDGKPVSDLQMLYGTEMHIVIVKDDFTSGDHTHSYIPGHYIHFGNATQKYFGPSIPVRHTFNSSGTYVVFSQFKHNGAIVTTKFMVKAGEGQDNFRIAVGIASIIFLVTIVYFAWSGKILDFIK